MIGLLGLALLLGQASAAEVYKKIDKDGHVIYSDTPLEDAEVIQIAPIKTYNAPPAPEETTTDADTAPLTAPQEYTITIVTPDTDTFIPMGANGIEVKILTIPKLHEDHLVRLNVDHKPYGEPQNGTVFTIKEMDNGTHTIQAIVVAADDFEQTISTSNEITIHTKRSFLFNPLLPPAPQMPRAPQAPMAPRAP
ncbi:MAG: DUF4124 domain-containing protein [Gammaproteobacteria bacterium]